MSTSCYYIENLLFCFIRSYINNNSYVQVLVNITRPYNKLTFGFLVNELLMPREEVETLLVEMILDKRLLAKIDQLNGCLIMTRINPINDSRSKFDGQLLRLADVLDLANDQICANTHH